MAKVDRPMDQAVRSIASRVLDRQNTAPEASDALAKITSMFTFGSAAAPSVAQGQQGQRANFYKSAIDSDRKYNETRQEYAFQPDGEDERKYGYDVIQKIQNLPSMRSTLDSIAQYEDLLRNMAQAPVRRDITPELALADYISGGRTAAAYQRPENLNEMSERIRSHLIGIEKAKNAYQDNLANMLNASKAGITQVTTTEKERQEAGRAADRYGGMSGRPQVNNPMEKVWQEASKSLKKDLEALQSGRDSRELVMQGTSVGDEILKRKLIQLSGDVKPSDKDVGAFGGNKTLLERAKQWYETNFNTGAFSDLNRSDLIKIIDGLDTLNKQRVREKLNGHARAAPKFQPSLSHLPTEYIANALYERALGYSGEAPSLPEDKLGPAPSQGQQQQKRSVQAGPKVGDIKKFGGKTYRFKGGSPSSKDSWDEVK